MKKQKYWVAGSTHIDLAWKKNESEMAEILDIFVVRLLDLLEQNSSFTYMLEQAYHYRQLKKRRPDLVERLARFVREGRLEFVGGMASTLETNMPNGECFIRNQLLGMRWVKDNFNADIRIGWLVDTFGLHAQIPQLLSQFGIRRLMANRFGGTKHHAVFIAEGINGSRILVVGRDAYAGYVDPAHVTFKMAGSWKEIDSMFGLAAKQHGAGPHLVSAYTENEMLLSDRPSYHIGNGNEASGAGTWGYATMSEYLDALEDSDEAWPVEQSDLNPEFTGTYSQRIQIRLRNRISEYLLLEAEKWAVLYGMHGWKEHVDDAWWLMSFNQFHDVFTGSHPTAVYDDVIRYYDRIDAVSSAVFGKVSCRDTGETDEAAACTGIVVYNGLPWVRNDIVELPLDQLGSGAKAVYCNGEKIPCDITDGKIIFAADLPAVGYRTFGIGNGDATPPRCVQTHEGMIENEYIRLECDDTAGIKRLIWKATGKVLLENAGDILVVQRDDGSFQIEDPHGAEVAACTGELKLFRYENTNVCQRLCITGEFPNVSWAGPDNRLRWEMECSVIPRKPVVMLRIKLDWHGEASRIRLKLSSHINTSECVYEIPFGTVKRKPYGVRGNAKGEWPAQRFVAVEDGAYGVALINTGVPGVETGGSTLWTTLLRSPKSAYAGMVPDETSSQHGTHSYTFGLAPYAGTWPEAGIVRAAMEMNAKPLCAVTHTMSADSGAEQSFITLEPSHVVLSTVKAPEDGGDEIIVRMYETAGLACAADLFMDGAGLAWNSDANETRYDELDCKNGSMKIPLKPYEIKTLRIQRLKRP